MKIKQRKRKKEIEGKKKGENGKGEKGKEMVKGKRKGKREE